MHLGAPELIAVLFLALLFFGPTRLPQLASSLGEAVRGFKKASAGDDHPALPPQATPVASVAPVAPVQPQNPTPPQA